MLRKSASPASTWFGGRVGVPRALRARDSTTMILVKLVQSSSSAGATPSTVVSTMIWTTWLGSPGMLTETLLSLAGVDGALGFVGPLGFSGAALKAVPAMAGLAMAGLAMAGLATAG